MTDMDFDELDRAVNSLMTKHQATQPSAEPARKDDDDVNVLKLDTSVKPDDDLGAVPVESREDLVVGQSEPEPRSEEAANELSPVESLDTGTVDQSDDSEAIDAATDSTPATGRINLPSRRSGRFMDVVHPSSDMRSETNSAARPLAAAKPAVSRTGLSLAPIDSVVSPTLKDEATEDVAAEPLHLLEATTDHLDSEREDTAEVSDNLQYADINSLELDTSVPLTTPFLSDAKVDKRPLGGPTPSDEVAEPQPEAEPESVEAPKEAEFNYPNDSEQDDTQNIPDRVVPAELRDDLMSLESDNTEPVDSDSSESVKSTEQPQAAVISQSSAASAAQPVGPIAITQQYQQEPSSSPTESGSIYDTSDYHQPLAHPTKAKSGWMWVVWVLVLLVLGAGSGAAAYFLLIQ